MTDPTDREHPGAGAVLRVLVVDDEPLGRERILDLLADEPERRLGMSP